jgi:hypothetical protein
LAHDWQEQNCSLHSAHKLGTLNKFSEAHFTSWVFLQCKSKWLEQLSNDILTS